MRPKLILIEGRKAYDYGDWVSRLRLPDYCPKCHRRDSVYVSHDEDGKDILRCAECHYSVIATTIRQPKIKEVGSAIKLMPQNPPLHDA